jgi:hypothetical protein
MTEPLPKMPASDPCLVKRGGALGHPSAANTNPFLCSHLKLK